MMGGLDRNQHLFSAKQENSPPTLPPQISSLHSCRIECEAAIIGNAGTLAVFRVGSEDAALLAPEFAVGTLDAGLALSPENRPVVADDLASVTLHRRNHTPHGCVAASNAIMSLSSRSCSCSVRQHRIFVSKVASEHFGLAAKCQLMP
jgi:hypothetical protein